MFVQLALFFTLVPLAELLFLYYMVTPLFAMIFTGVTGVLGGVLLYRQGRRCWRTLNRQLDFGESPTAMALDGGLILLAGGLLISPGILTDLVGLLLLIPLFRMLVVSHLLLRFEVYRHRPRTAPPSGDSETLDV